MPTGKLHDDEVHTDVDLVRRLLAAQHPQWAGLPIEPFDSSGTTNWLYRLGDDLSVRLPRQAGSTQIEIERRWLPQLAPHLPLAIPDLLAVGTPGEGYPFVWAVYRWLEGEPAVIGGPDDSRETATALGRFVTALRRMDPTGGREPGEGNYYRGCPLADRDDVTHEALRQLRGTIDTDAAAAAWQEALAAPVWSEPPLWIHGDLMPGNLLFERSRLTAIIDFGGLGVGDPACDLIVAWDFFSAATRDAYRAAVASDDATWARGRGWALSVALLQLPYYATSNSALADIAQYTIDEVLADHRRMT